MATEQPKWGASRQISIGMLGLLVLVVGVGGWSVLTTIAGAVIAPGMLEVQSNRQVVQHPDGGIVGEIFVEDGDFVEAGQTVMVLDDSILRSELAIIEGQYFELLARRGRLEAESEGKTEITFVEEVLDRALSDARVFDIIQGQSRLFQARIETQEQQVNQLRERQTQIRELIAGREAQLVALNEQLDLIKLELADLQSLLDRGLAQASRVLALRREEAGLRGQIGELRASVAESRGRIAEIEIEILGLTTRLREEAITALRDLQASESELRERRLATLETLSRLEIRSPMSGFVLDRQVHAQRAVIRSAEPLMYIVPQDSPLVITSRVEVQHIDQVNMGQDANLRFSAFDARSTPEIWGVVTRISADAIMDENTGLTYYEAQILPKEGEIERLGDVELIPGMPVEAFIQTGSRSPLTFLTKPLTDYFTKAFREG
ncbi:HlyD family secretion protein [Rubricella aquisinus]|uniref:Membrane fusion protein (MFP) family protein n=1 Tax=Rubricella aquisinus TaxID=2028108 RepID=A0A840X2F7_9RHOB|nr:HlyD family type I secretion periplasmic adaptor subunit [Rubricella aquisinus]MBB5517004.1 HlyD family secretion protein [Rubricella aquisinus]